VGRVTVRRRPLPQSIRRQVFIRDRFICHYCGMPLSPRTGQVDHVVPVAEGGADEAENLVSACGNCNRGKSSKSIAEWATAREASRLQQLWMDRSGHPWPMPPRVVRGLIEAYGAPAVEGAFLSIAPTVGLNEGQHLWVPRLYDYLRTQRLSGRRAKKRRSV